MANSLINIGLMTEYNEQVDLTTCSSNATTTGWACNKTDCPSYGKWYCPFSW